MPTPNDWPGREIADPGGTRYGRLDDLFVGQESGEPEFGIVTVPRPGGEGTKRVAVPMHTASLSGDVIVLPLDPVRVKSAPEVQDEVDAIPPESGRRVLDYFGMGGDAPTVPMPSLTPEAETVLSEEQLEVDVEARAAERVRIRKQVVTEEVTVTVEVRREELVIEREPIPRDEVGAPSEGAFADSEAMVIVLHAEEPVVGRRVVPVERVRLRKDLVVEQTTINEPVRKERAEVEHIPITEEPRT
jgi:uncharacterized protein (TIGR02271 family)